MKSNTTKHGPGKASFGWQGGYGGSYTGAGKGRGTGGHSTQGFVRRTWYDPAGLARLVSVLAAYDRARERLAREGGRVADLRALTGMLTEPFIIEGPYGSAEATLNAPQSVRKALNKAGQYDAHLEIRRVAHDFPAYYLARTHRDWWGAYGLVVEDVHRSGDFTLDDPRFVKFMYAGRGKHYLRLAAFRDKVGMLEGMKQGDDLDGFLYTLGRCVFQGAWHVDQRFSFMVADAFGLGHLKSAVEVTYMCLSVDLFGLRRHLTDDMRRFFSESYQNEPLVLLLNMLPSLKPQQFAALSRNASDCYLSVTEHFNRFLGTELPWRALNDGPMPLWKLLLGNMKRLDVVARHTTDFPEFKSAREALEAGTRESLQCLMNVQTT